MYLQFFAMTFQLFCTHYKTCLGSLHHRAATDIFLPTSYCTVLTIEDFTGAFDVEVQCLLGGLPSVLLSDSVSLLLLTLGAHARGLQYLSCLSVCVSVCLCVCVFSLFWHLAQSGVQTAVSATSARYGHEI